jgi:hypothetical protein
MTNLEVVCHVLVSDTIITYLLKIQAASMCISVKTFIKLHLLICYRFALLNRLKVLLLHGCSRAGTSPRTEPLRQRAEHHT